jgi:GWxTD domain-containing protein
MKKLFNISIVLLAVAGLLGCASTSKINYNNLSHLYQQDGVVLRPMFSVYHNQPGESTVFMQASSDQLLYKVGEDNKFNSRYSIHFDLYESYEFDVLLDSATVTFEDVKSSQETKVLLEEIIVNTSKSRVQTPVLKIIITDLNRKLSYHNYLDISLGDEQNRQNFKLTSLKGRIRFMNTMMVGEKFFLENNANAQSYFVRQYKRKFPLATPPYVDPSAAQFKYEAERKYKIKANDTLSFVEPGFYHFQLNENSKEGFTIYVFNDEFPFINHRTQMAEPLRYLTSQREFNIMMSQGTPDSIKYQVDKFWLKSAGSAARGKVLVREYYNRIQDANIFFTSYLEGWKTDRGIVYTVLGPPSKVTRDFNTETWVYGNESSSLDMVFTFVKVYNPFSDKDYALAKLNKYRYVWGQAIDGWRHGTAYGLKEIIREQDERDQQVRMANQPYSWN